MKPEEKYFVIPGIREDFQWYSREDGYWLCRKDEGSTFYVEFYKDKKEADRQCEKYREAYREAISSFKEGDIVWFMHDNRINIGKVRYIFEIGYMMRYKISDCDGFLKNSDMFKSKEELLEDLNNHIIGNEAL